MAQLNRKRAVQIDSFTIPTATKQEVLALRDEGQQDRDLHSDSDSSESLVSTTSDGEEDTDSGFMSLDVPELRSIRNGVSKEDFVVNTTLHQLHPWIAEGIDDASLYSLRVQLFQDIFRLCDWLDQKYHMESMNSYADISYLFRTNPQLALEIDECWKNPEGSFLHICDLGKYWDNMRPI